MGSGFRVGAFQTFCSVQCWMLIIRQKPVCLNAYNIDSDNDVQGFVNEGAENDNPITTVNHLFLSNWNLFDQVFQAQLV